MNKKLNTLEFLAMTPFYAGVFTAIWRSKPVLSAKLVDYLAYL